MKIRLSAKKLGFSIIEVVVAISIIFVGLIGIMTLSTQNSQIQGGNKTVLIASMLAQEGIELVRSRRDNNWLESLAWDNNLSGSFTVNYSNHNPVPTASIDDARLYINASGFYDYDNSGTPTPFYRLISIANQTAYSMDVRCRVKWNEKGDTKEYVAQTLLYDWK
jgi:type II secretory pathway pseudopilin PulG